MENDEDIQIEGKPRAILLSDRLTGQPMALSADRFAFAAEEWDAQTGKLAGSIVYTKIGKAIKVRESVMDIINLLEGDPLAATKQDKQISRDWPEVPTFPQDPPQPPPDNMY